MHVLEKFFITLRHSPGLSRASWLWNAVRPAYNLAVNALGRRGLDRTINGLDAMRVLPQCRGITEQYEPVVWTALMEAVRPGDVIADVGAFIGLYTVALAGRVGDSGMVIAFEPDPENVAILRGHVALNDVAGRVRVVQAAVSDRMGRVSFSVGGMQSSLGTGPGAERIEVDCVRLDTVVPGGRLDIVKIDVEGFEEHVLRGASGVLADSARRPRAIFVEVHPYAWKDAGTTSESLLGLLRNHGYRVQHLDGRPVEAPIDAYGEIVARLPVLHP